VTAFQNNSSSGSPGGTASRTSTKGNGGDAAISARGPNAVASGTSLGGTGGDGVGGQGPIGGASRVSALGANNSATDGTATGGDSGPGTGTGSVGGLGG
jgi:hypothetical protein